MKRTFVESSSLVSVGYDPALNILELEFHTTGCYQYFAVPRQVVEKLMAAKSKGAHFNAHIKARFPFKRVS